MSSVQLLGDEKQGQMIELTDDKTSKFEMIYDFWFVVLTKTVSKIL